MPEVHVPKPRQEPTSHLHYVPSLKGFYLYCIRTGQPFVLPYSKLLELTFKRGCLLVDFGADLAPSSLPPCARVLPLQSQDLGINITLSGQQQTRPDTPTSRLCQPSVESRT